MSHLSPSVTLQADSRHRQHTSMLSQNTHTSCWKTSWALLGCMLSAWSSQQAANWEILPASAHVKPPNKVYNREPWWEFNEKTLCVHLKRVSFHRDGHSCSVLLFVCFQSATQRNPANYIFLMSKFKAQVSNTAVCRLYQIMIFAVWVQLQEALREPNSGPSGAPWTHSSGDINENGFLLFTLFFYEKTVFSIWNQY